VSVTPSSSRSTASGSARRPGAGSASSGGGASARAAAIAAVTNWTPSAPPLNFAEESTQELFGANVFSPITPHSL
jgi:glutamine synthetase